MQYLDWCVSHPEFELGLVKEAVRLGDSLLGAAGSVEAAAASLRKARDTKLGNPLAGVLDPNLSGALDPQHREYLQEMAVHGVPVRRQ